MQYRWLIAGLGLAFLTFNGDCLHAQPTGKSSNSWILAGPLQGFEYLPSEQRSAAESDHNVTSQTATFNQYSAHIFNRYAPFQIGAKWTHRGQLSGVATLETFAVVDTESVGGVQCVKILAKATLGSPVNTNLTDYYWYAQDVDTNLWQLKKVDETNHSEDDNAYLLMPGSLFIGQQINDSGHTWQIESTNETVTLTTGLGPYHNCVVFQRLTDGRRGPHGRGTHARTAQ